MIKCGDKLEGKPQCILYSKDGSKVLNRFPYSKHGGKEGAKKAAGKREGRIQFFKKKSLEAAVEQFGAAPVLAYIAKSEAERGNPALQNELAAYVEKKKEEPGFGDVWEKKFGGSVDKCIKMMEGKVDDAGAYCASLKDKALKRTTWRGKGKHEKKSFEDEVEEALGMLKKDEQTEEPKMEEEPTLDDMLEGVNLADLEQFLVNWGQKPAAEEVLVEETLAEETPIEVGAADWHHVAPPETVVENSPVTEVVLEEEILPKWRNDFKNFIRQDFQRRQAAIQEAIFGPAEEGE